MRTYTPIMLLSAICITLLITGCQNADATPSADPEQPAATTVEVISVERGTLHASLSTTTILEAYQEADITPRVSGIIEEVLVAEGDVVVAGQILAELDKERLEQAAHQAAAELRGVEQELARLNELANRKMVSADALDRLRANHDTLKARLRLAQIELEASTIRAPFDGVINRRYAKSGNFVQQHSRESLFHLVDLNRLQAVLHIPERNIAQVQIGQSVVFEINEQRVVAAVSRISPAADRVSGTFRVVVDIDNREATPLRAGMFARAELRYATQEHALRIPADAILQLDGEEYVYVVNDERAQRQPIRTGIRQGRWIEVTDGVAEHSAIVITGQAHLNDNAPVISIVRNNTAA